MGGHRSAETGARGESICDSQNDPPKRGHTGSHGAWTMIGIDGPGRHRPETGSERPQTPLKIVVRNPGRGESGASSGTIRKAGKWRRTPGGSPASCGRRIRRSSGVLQIEDRIRNFQAQSSDPARQHRGFICRARRPATLRPAPWHLLRCDENRQHVPDAAIPTPGTGPPAPIPLNPPAPAAARDRAAPVHHGAGLVDPPPHLRAHPAVGIPFRPDLIRPVDVLGDLARLPAFPPALPQ